MPTGQGIEYLVKYWWNRIGWCLLVRLLRSTVKKHASLRCEEWRSCCSNSQLDLCHRWMFQVLRTPRLIWASFFFNDRTVMYWRELLFKLPRLFLGRVAYAECMQFRFQFGRWPSTAQKPLRCSCVGTWCRKIRADTLPTPRMHAEAFV